MLKNTTIKKRLRKHRKKRSLTLLTVLAVSLCCLTYAAAGPVPVFAAGGNSNYSLEGAKYQLYTNEGCTTKAKDVNGKNALLTTDADGKAGVLEMDTGTYYAKEVTPGKGYKLDTTVHKVKVTESDTKSVPASFTSKEPPAYGTPNFRVYKTATEEKYMDYSKFLGTEFTVKYYAVEKKSEIAAASPKDQWTFVTVKKDPPAYDNDPSHYYAGFDWQTDTPVSSSRQDKSFYLDSKGRRVLPLGWFTIEETKAPAGFKLTDEVYYGHIYQESEGSDAVTVMEGQNIHGDLIKEIVFRDEPNDVYIKKTDTSSGKELAGVRLQVLQGSTVRDEWVSSSGEHKIEGLEAGTYTLREVSAPYGYDLADDVSFVVKEGEDTHVEMKNTPVTVTTSAADHDTGKRIGSVKTSEIITDSVHMTGLHAGRKYKVTGKLMDKASGKPIKSGSSDVTASKEFTATAAVMDVKVDFTVDSSQFKAGTKAVVYETLLRTSPVHGESVPAELQKHENINDTAQTIVYPGISTTASGKASGTRNILAGANAVITDTVSYTGLLAGETYRLEGELYDKTTGQLTGIKSSAEFKAAAENGTASMEFSFDADGMAGHTLVVFETLKSGSTVLVDHKNKDDAAQTIYIPKIGTTAGIAGDNHEIKDIISYENLLPDTDYIFRGWLVNTATGEKVPGSDGSVTLSTGSKTSGQAEMVMKTDGFDEMNGRSMTAFEELYIVVKTGGAGKEIPVAYHKDRNDKSQTVEIYQDLKIQKNVTGNLGDLTKIFEYTAEFTDLVPGAAYTAEGDDEKTFNADASGKATVPFKLKDDQKVTIKQLPKNAKYKITEAPSDHVAEYRVFSEDMADKGAKIVKLEGSNGDEAAKALSTALETVNMFDGTVVVLWENNRDLATLTAVRTFTGIRLLALTIVLTGTAALLARRKRNREEI